MDAKLTAWNWNISNISQKAMWATHTNCENDCFEKSFDGRQQQSFYSWLEVVVLWDFLFERIKQQTQITLQVIFLNFTLHKQSQLRAINEVREKEQRQNQKELSYNILSLYDHR